jgi:Spx/MgsR family transcriptional regulator
MHPIVFGNPNCDTVKKARVWLTEHGFQVSFHDFKKKGVPAAALQTWLTQLGWEKLLNRQGTTWRKLDADLKASVIDAASAAKIMSAHPSTIKRPVIVWPSGQITLGFVPDQWPG